MDRKSTIQQTPNRQFSTVLSENESRLKGVLKMSERGQDSERIFRASISVGGRNLYRGIDLPMGVNRLLCSKAIALVLGIISIGISGKLCHAAALPPSTAIPAQYS